MWSSAVNTSMLVEAPPPLVEDYSQTRTTIYMGFASFVILIWEHAITFSDEVEYIWRGRKGFFVVLFFINRYLTPLSFLGNLYAYLSSSWTHEKCKHFVRYEGAMIVIALNVTGLMMLMRIHALYRWKPAVVWCTACILAAEFSVNTWLVTHGKPVRHNRGNHSALACTMIFDVDKVGHMGAASAWLPLTYDTVILLLTLYHTLGLIRNKTAGRTAKVLLQDGILYYSVIFSINLVLTIMIASAPPGVQNITAQTEQLFTVAMMSRITIHLRKQGRAGAHDDTSYPTFSQQLDGPVVPIPRFFQSGKTGKRGREEQGVKVAVQETSVTHDDRGVVVVKAGPGATEEWIEMRAPSPVLLPRRDSQVQFMV